MKQASPKARRPKTILSTNRKVQTQKRRRLLIWTLSSTRLKLMVELNQFCRNLLERTEEKRRRIRTGESSQSSAQYKLTVILRRNQYIFNITKDNEFEKSRKVLAAKPIRKSVVLTRARRRKRTASCSGQPWRWRGYPVFYFEFGDPNPVALQRTVWWFLYKTLVSEQENISQVIRYMPPEVHFTFRSRVPYNKQFNLLTELAWVALGNISPKSWQYGPSAARSVLQRLRANIPQYGPRAQLVSGYNNL